MRRSIDFQNNDLQVKGEQSGKHDKGLGYTVDNSISLAISQKENAMLSIRDCLDYCDITDEEVALIAEHEDIPDAAAAQLVCCMVQSPEGVQKLAFYLDELIERAARRGDREKFQLGLRIRARFLANHPLPQ